MGTLNAMNDRVPAWAAPGRASTPEPMTWLSMVLRVAGVPAMACLWWALAFLPSSAGSAPMVDSWPPTLPIQLTDLEVAVFGPLGAALVVVALLRRTGLAFLSILLGFLVSAFATLARGADTQGSIFNATERNLMFFVCAMAALAGLAIGTAAIRSLLAFGFLGLLAVFPVVSLVSLVLFSHESDNPWLVRPALAVLLVMIAWRRWSGALVWPVFFALFWLLNLAMAAVGYGAHHLRYPDGSQAALGSVVDAMPDFVRSAWSDFLGTRWADFWPAAIMAALFVAGQWAWRRFDGAVGT